ncbi:prepilin peptidase [Actinomadura algeriensis]|uniref:Leader peptidase (Prepilin peptidase)/N-methyltransferase n=1 Tax=Actinomadura algeriensis TaxID=1679523 RepID=A0ABR9JUD8_9ACTN|nr:A24 family peptidase [Actinomadura algeriensis]MBE1534177.1 leader peptidase (prepilin peptidase)/N-methyltransferase [Actinomadura algeriensis]
MIALALLPLGFVTGRLIAPLAEPYVGDVPARDRTAVGAVTALVFGVLGFAVGPAPVLPALLYVGLVGTLLAFVDVHVKRLPDEFTLPSYAIVPVLLAAAVPFAEDGPRHFAHALLGMAGLFLLYAVPAFVKPSWLGLGDVKLAGVLGLCLGWFGLETWLAAVLLTYLLSGVLNLGIMIVRRTLRREFAYGPYMLAGALGAAVLA